MNIKKYAMIGLISGASVALIVHQGRAYVNQQQQIANYHQEMMLAMDQPLTVGSDPTQIAPNGGLPLDASPEPGTTPEKGSVRPNIEFKTPIPPLPPISKSYTLILKKSSKLVPVTKDPIWDLQLVTKEGVVLDNLSAVTGRASRQNHDRNTAGNKSPLPPGVYRIDRLGIERGPFSDPELGSGYWVPITPMFNTNRSDLGFHVDPSWGKQNGESGTSGCIGLQNTDATVKLVTWIKHFNISQLVVQS